MEHRVYFYTSWILNKTLEEEAALKDQGEEVANLINDYQLSIANKSPIINTNPNFFGELHESIFSDNFSDNSLENTTKVMNENVTKDATVTGNLDEHVEMQEEFECVECNDWYSTDTFDQHFILVPLCAAVRKRDQFNINKEDIIVNKEIQKKIAETSDFYEETFDEVEDIHNDTKERSVPAFENGPKFRYEGNLEKMFDNDVAFNEDESFEASFDDGYDKKVESGKVESACFDETRFVYEDANYEDETRLVYEDANYVVHKVNRRLFENYEFEEPRPM